MKSGSLLSLNRYFKACKHHRRPEMTGLTVKQIATLEKRLKELEMSLQEQFVMSSASSKTVSLDQTMIGRLSRVDSLQQQNMAIFSKRRAAIRLEKVKAAIQLIALREYGFCQKCGLDIGYARLETQPETSLCFGCQDKADQKC